MKFDVVITGGGLAGLLVAEQLQKKQLRVAVVEPYFARSVPPWALVHRHPGKRIFDEAIHQEAYSTTAALLASLPEAIARRCPIVRPDWKHSGLVPEGAHLLTEELINESFPGVQTRSAHGIWYEEAWCVQGRRLLEHLRDLFLLAGGCWYEEKAVKASRVGSDADWKLKFASGKDVVAHTLVLALGSDMKNSLGWPGLSSNGGSLLKIEGEQRLKFAVSGGGHLAPVPGGGIVAGSTYLHGAAGAPPPEPDKQSEIDVLKRKAVRIMPHLNMAAVSLWSGKRATIPQDKQPVAGVIARDLTVWLLGGLASKGLFWGPLLASQLAHSISCRSKDCLEERFNPQRIKGFQPVGDAILF